MMRRLLFTGDILKMKVINSGLILVIAAMSFFVAGNIRAERMEDIMFDRMLTDTCEDSIAKDILDLAVLGIDEYGEAIISEQKLNIDYKLLVNKTMGATAEDCTAFIVLLGEDDFDAETVETYASEQIKTVNKRLNYSFLFTEYTSSFRYNPTCKNSVYIMYLPKFSNHIRPERNGCVYTLSGAKLE